MKLVRLIAVVLAIIVAAVIAATVWPAGDHVRRVAVEGHAPTGDTEPIAAEPRTAFDANLSLTMLVRRPGNKRDQMPTPRNGGSNGDEYVLEFYWDEDEGLWLDGQHPDAALELTSLAIRAQAAWPATGFRHESDFAAIIDAITRRLQPTGVAATPGQTPSLQSTWYAAYIAVLLEQWHYRPVEPALTALLARLRALKPLPCRPTLHDAALAARLKAIGVPTACDYSPAATDDTVTVDLPSGDDVPDVAQLDRLLDRQTLSHTIPNLAPTSTELDAVARVFAQASPGDERIAHQLWRAVSILAIAGRDIPGVDPDVEDYLSYLIW